MNKNVFPYGSGDYSGVDIRLALSALFMYKMIDPDRCSKSGSQALAETAVAFADALLKANDGK